MAKVNQNKLIGGLAVAVITMVVVIVIVVIAKELFPANTKNSSSTVIGTDTNQLFTAAPVTTTTTTTTTSADPDPAVTTTPEQNAGGDPLTTTTTAGASNELSGKTIYLNTSVYLRSSASWGSDKGAIVNKGESATVVKVEGDWYVLEYNGSQGYVYKEYISEAPIG